MAYPTRAQIRQRFWITLDDPTGAVFVDFPSTAPAISYFQMGLDAAYSAMYNAMLNYQVPRISDIQQNFIITPDMTRWAPQENGLPDFSEYDYVAERPAGSGQRFKDMCPVERLPQRPPADRLLEFVWREDAFYFVGVNTPTELQIQFETSGVAPISNDGIIKVDDCVTFLSNYAVGLIGPTKGRYEIGKAAMLAAVGPRYNDGFIGGDLYRLIAPKERELQWTPIQPKRFSAYRRRGFRFAVPYVAAQQGTTGGGAINVPIQFSSATGAVIGTIDGVNTLFYIPQGGVISMQVYNGMMLTEGLDYSFVNNQILFTAPPPLGSTITIEAWFSYDNNVQYTQGGYGTGPYGEGGFGTGIPNP